MQVSGKRRSFSSAKNADIPVSPMKNLEGGAKGSRVLEISEISCNSSPRVYKRRLGLTNQSVGVTEKRKSWRSDSLSVTERTPPIQIRKSKSDVQNVPDQVKVETSSVVTSNEMAKSPVMLRKSKSDSCKSTPDDIHVDQTCKEYVVENDKSAIQIREDRSCPPSGLSNADQAVKPEVLMICDGGEDEDDEGNEHEEDIIIEIEKKNFDVKIVKEDKGVPKVVKEEQKVQKTVLTPIPLSSNVSTKPIPVAEEIKRTPPIYEEYVSFSQPQSKLQNFVDLIMWKDVSRSAFVFGIGTFILLSSSFTKDLNISLVSVVSYMGLIYLAAIFLFRSLLCRGVVDSEEPNEAYIVGEDEAIWLLELVLPYLNEFLLKLKALFSGDPATTMKLAILLFVLARCGSSITIWKMAKLGFFGVFTIPKIFASYSGQLTGIVTFWVRRFQDAWDTCVHKKAVAATIFTMLWNLSSIVARIWGVFMLYVAFRYYQQTILSKEDDWQDEKEEKDEEVSSSNSEVSSKSKEHKWGTTNLTFMKEKRR